MRRGTAILAIVAALAAGVGLGYSLAGKGGGARGPAGEVEGSSDGEVATLRAERDELRRELAAAKEKADAAAAQPDRPASRDGDEAGAATEGEEASGEEPPARAGSRFFGDEYGGALRDLDWKAIGENMSGMAGLIRELTPALRKGEAPSPELVGRAQQLNGPLVTAALKLPEDVPGTGPNGRFSNPAFMANAIAAALEAAGRPLTDSQARRLEDLSREYLGLDSRRRSGYDDSTLELVKLVEEAELKERWFHDVFAMLEPAQVEALGPPEARGRVRIDVFSSSLVFVGRVGIFTFTDRDDLVEKVLGRIGSSLGFDDAKRRAARSVVDTWVGGLPADLVGQEWNTLDVQGMVTAARAIAWGKQGVELLKKLRAGLALDEEQAEGLRDAGGVWIPLREDARVE